MKVVKRIILLLVGLGIGILSFSITVVQGKIIQAQENAISSQELLLHANEREVADKKSNESGYWNIALFGVDTRNGNLGSGTRSDTIIIASIHRNTKKIKLISVYRDTLLDIKNGNLQKCNAAYAFGGPKQAVQMLNKNLDLDITHYVTVDFSCLVDFIDAVGGIEIQVTDSEAKEINQYLQETAKVSDVKTSDLKGGGVYQMDGAQAVTYARIRKLSGGDFRRSERQQIVIQKLADKIKTCNLVEISLLIDQFLPSVETNIDLNEILPYAAAYKDLIITESKGFPFDKTTATVSGLGSIVIPRNYTENVRTLHKELFPENEYLPSENIEEIETAIEQRIGSY